MASLKSEIVDDLKPLQQQMDKLIACQQVINTAIGATEADIAAIKASLSAIQLFLGADNAGATPEQIDALGQRVLDTTQQVESITPNA